MMPKTFLSVGKGAAEQIVAGEPRLNAFHLQR